MCIFEKRISYVQNLSTRKLSSSNQGSLHCHHTLNCYMCMFSIHTNLQMTSQFFRAHRHRIEREVQNMCSAMLTVYILQSTYLIKLLSTYLITHTNTCIYILFKKSKIYTKTFKTLLYVSITRSSSGSVYCSLLKL